MSPQPNASLQGSAVGLFLFDVCEEIRLDELRSILGARRLGEGMKHAAAEQIFFERPPVVEDAQFPGEAQARVRVKYYDYGVVSVVYQVPFSGGWDDLVRLSSRWVWDVDFASRVEPLIRQKLERVPAAMVKAYDRWLSEDYFIFHVNETGSATSAADLIRDHGLEIAQVVRASGRALPAGRLHRHQPDEAEQSASMFSRTNGPSSPSKKAKDATCPTFAVDGVRLQLHVLEQMGPAVRIRLAPAGSLSQR